MKQNNYPDANLPKLNKYNLANIFNVYTDENFEDIYFYNICRTVNFEGLGENPEDDYVNNIFDYYTIAGDDTWTIISFKQYETIELWWLVCKCNGVIDPTETLEVGRVVRVFKKTYIENILRSMRNV